MTRTDRVSSRPYRRALVAAGLAGAVAMTAACGGSTGTNGSKTDSHRPFTVNWAASISSLDPAFVCPGDDNSFASNFYGRLVQLSATPDKDGFTTVDPDPAKVKPDLATSWKVSDDGKTYTFTLPAGKKFANGDPLDAAAVKYSLERTVKMGACGALSLQLGITDPPLITGVDAPDATTVVLHMRRAYPEILYSLAQSRGSIYDPKLIEANGGVKAGSPNEWLQSHTASSSGPYVLKTYVPNSRAVLERNPNYYGTPAIEPVVQVNFITSVPTLLLQAQNSQADVTLGLPPQSVSNVQGKACCTVFSAGSATPVTVSLNHKGPVTDNVKFREALTYAVPYKDIISKIAYGYGDSYYGPVVPGMAGYNASLEPARAYDPDKARQLLAASGLKSPSIDLMINPQSPGVSDIATLLQSSWQAVGVKVNIVAKPPTDFSTLFNDGTYQSALLFENSTPLGSYELRKKMTCGSSFNNQHICLPGSTPLLEKLNDTTDPAQQQQVIDQLTQLWVDNSPTIILYRARFTAVLAKDVKHFAYAGNLRIADWGR
ncbi:MULTISPECIES: ABC transporter substrate-binding protein [unclassified Streptomyces]|uniref:ABC transporter substrate-binding protein n=1 Tax=unclassified Streptomyces TaxID=2593676 RepID=UPI002E2B80C3|nr:ABC transporter substrate-binding protein [Streptomyces sp. NBC_00223]